MCRKRLRALIKWTDKRVERMEKSLRPKLLLQVFLFVVQVTFLTTYEEKMNWVFQLLDLDETGMVNHQDP